MNVDTCAFQALTAQVAELAERVNQLDKRALVIRQLRELRIERAGGDPRAILEEELALRCLPSASRNRPAPGTCVRSTAASGERPD